jgi:excisionase family DNA binding protein
MTDLLTTKEVLELLKIDRTTIYRMVNDGRLKAVKVGKQWRFPRKNVLSFIANPAISQQKPKLQISSILPVHCIQPIQDVFAEIADVGSVTTSSEGLPLTEISNSCEFCNLILSSKKGREGCIASWKRLASQTEQDPQFVTCHAGLQYARARIQIDDQQGAMLIAGQFHTSPPSAGEMDSQLLRIASKYNLDREKLKAAAQKVGILEVKRRNQISQWLQKVALTFEQVTRERAEYSRRLKKIADLSQVHDT